MDSVTPPPPGRAPAADPLQVIRKVIVASINGQVPDAKIDEAVTILRYAYDHGDDDLRAMAVMALNELGPSRPPVFAVLLAATRDEAGPVRKRAVRAVGQAGTRAAAGLTYLMARLADESEAVRCEAIQALGELGRHAADAVPALMALLTHPSGRIRTVIGASLRKIGGGAVPFLLAALQNPDDDSRERAACILGAMGRNDGDLIEALLATAMGDPLASVRDEARRALARIEDAAGRSLRRMRE